MSMTRADAKNYIARVLSAVSSQQAQVWAEEAIQRAFTDFQLARNWEFLLKDTSSVRNLDLVNYLNNNEATPYTAGQFNGLNVGQTLYSSLAFNSTGGKNTIKEIQYDAYGVPVKLVFDLVHGTSSITPFTTTAAGDIVINAGQSDYNLPEDFYAPATTRILGSSGYKVEYIRNGLWYKAASMPDENGIVEFYSLFNGTNGSPKLRLRFPPQKDDVLRIEYFRQFKRNDDPIDIPDDLLYKFLDYCRALVLEVRSAAEQPAAFASRALSGLGQAALADSEPVDDEDIGLHSQMSTFSRYWEV